MSKQILLMTILLSAALLNGIAAFYYKSHFDALQTQYRHHNQKTRHIVIEVSQLAKDIRIATYPTACDAATKAIIGENCDLGNYMEWAGPQLEHRTQQLLLLSVTD